MESSYIKALETRVRWLRWAQEQGAASWADFDKIKRDAAQSGIDQLTSEATRIPSFKSYLQALPSYISVLENGDTFFMNRKFGSLVNHARLSIPDDLAYENNWLQSQQGWLWIEEPFTVPEISQEAKDRISDYELDLTGKTSIKEMLDNTNPALKIREKGINVKVAAIGWFPVAEGTRTSSDRIAGPGATEFLCYQDFGLYANGALGFGCWSYFMLQDGDRLIDRIRQFENIALKDGGAYTKDRTTDMMHEIRWVYAAFYLMAQRLAITFHRDTDRNTKRRAIRENRPVPDFIRVISLRKMEEDKKKDVKSFGNSIDYQWQWTVMGHWRNQYFPSTGEHKPTFIEAYVKGPPDKPMKPEGTRIFVARR